LAFFSLPSPSVASVDLIKQIKICVVSCQLMMIIQRRTFHFTRKFTKNYAFAIKTLKLFAQNHN